MMQKFLDNLMKVLETLIEYFCGFIIAHPRFFCTIVGTLGALALIAFVLSINFLIGG